MQLEEYFDFERNGDPDRIILKGTRVPIEIILDEFHRGQTPEQIRQSFPTVTLEQVYATVTYYLHNQAEIDAYLERSRQTAEAAYEEWRQTHKPSALEERLRKLREGRPPSQQVAS